LSFLSLALASLHMDIYTDFYEPVNRTRLFLLLLLLCGAVFYFSINKVLSDILPVQGSIISCVGSGCVVVE